MQNISLFLSDGAAIATTALSNNQTTNLVMEIWVDTNGAKGPNIIGRDFFNYVCIQKWCYR